MKKVVMKKYTMEKLIICLYKKITDYMALAKN